MHYFAILCYEITDMTNYNHDFITSELEELGLYGMIKTKNEDLSPLPKCTFIGEYKFQDKEELKNLLYGEVKKLFESNGLKATVFIAVSEKATIGLDSF
ncbi:MAG TPA: hypothetical protein PKG52_04250 [bacterium]|nr:hypothetical protein [bacterium]HPS28697.1 hypothetical protein [bacterium]